MLLLMSMSVAFSQAPNGTEDYYKSANGKSGAALKTALHNVIKLGEKDVTDYKQLEGAYEETDRMPNGYFRDRYSNITKFTTLNSGSNAKEGGMCNKEHSFPKSWFGGKVKPMYSDIVHVVPSDAFVNNKRSNLPFGENRGESYKSSGGYSKVGACTVSGFSGDCFEPNDEWKGDFARIYFYMVTCYEDKMSNWSCPMFRSSYSSYQPFADWAFNMLMRWAAEDPVSEIEVARQAGIDAAQGNRNPFVDFPSLAEYIWGDSIDYAFSLDGSSHGGGPDIDPTPQFATLLDCSMRSGLAPFFVRTYDGCDGVIWTSSSQYGAKANAFSIPGKEADEYLMVNLDLTHAETATLSFEHATGYNKTEQVKDTYFQVLVSEDYDGVPEDATWQMLDAVFPPLPAGGGFTSFVSSGDINLSSYSGKNVTLAFRYLSNSSASYCWEVRDVKVTAYTVPDRLPFIADDEGESGSNKWSDGKCFDLTGRQVPQGTKGIVIRNGKKILQK